MRFASASANERALLSAAHRPSGRNAVQEQLHASGHSVSACFRDVPLTDGSGHRYVRCFCVDVRERRRARPASRPHPEEAPSEPDDDGSMAFPASRRAQCCAAATETAPACPVRGYAGCGPMLGDYVSVPSLQNRPAVYAAAALRYLKEDVLREGNCSG